MRISLKKNCTRCRALVNSRTSAFQVKPASTAHPYGCIFAIKVTAKKTGRGREIEYSPTKPCPKPLYVEDVDAARKMLYAAMDENGRVQEQPRKKAVKGMQRIDALNIAMECMKAANMETFPMIKDALDVIQRMHGQEVKRKETERAYRESVPKRDWSA